MRLQERFYAALVRGRALRHRTGGAAWHPVSDLILLNLRKNSLKTLFRLQLTLAAIVFGVIVHYNTISPPAAGTGCQRNVLLLEGIARRIES